MDDETLDRNLAMMSLTDKLRMDLAWFNMVGNGPVLNRRGTLHFAALATVMALRSESFHAVLLCRLAAAAHRSGHRIVSGVLSRRLRRRFACAVVPTAEIGGGLRLPHPYGIVIGAGVRIGEMVTIGQHVTLGANFDKTDSRGARYPSVGAWTWITAGAVVAGPVRIGVDVTVGANAVVARDAADHTIVAGVPAKVLRNKADKGNAANGRQYLKTYQGYSQEVISALTPDCTIDYQRLDERAGMSAAGATSSPIGQ